MHASKIKWLFQEFSSQQKYQKEGKLDLGQLFDKLVRVFRIDDITNTKDKRLQTAMAAHMQLQPKKFMPKKSSPPVIRAA
jgi:hypothetical protein